MEAEVIRATLEHARMMAPHIKAPDIAELKATSNMTPEEGLLDCLRRSVIAWTWVKDGRPVFMFGIACNGYMDGKGLPWGLGTDEACKFPKMFIRGSRKAFKEVTGLFPHLENYVDSRHKAAIRWLKHIGFTIHDPEPIGRNGELFHRFEVVR